MSCDHCAGTYQEELQLGAEQELVVAVVRQHADRVLVGRAAVGQPTAVDGDLEVVLVHVVVHAGRDLVERVLVARGDVVELEVVVAAEDFPLAVDHVAGLDDEGPVPVARGALGVGVAAVEPAVDADGADLPLGVDRVAVDVGVAVLRPVAACADHQEVLLDCPWR